MGLGAFLLHIALQSFYLPDELYQLVFSWLFWLAAFLAVVGFFLYQKALFHGQISKAVPVTTALTIVVPALLSVVFLNQALPIVKILGIIIIIFSISVIAR